MKTPTIQHTWRALLALTLAAPLTLSACGDDDPKAPAASAPEVTCGTGTRLDEEASQCIPDGTTDSPDFNRVVDSAVIGDLTLSAVSVPDSLAPSEPQTHTFTITNTTTEDSGPIFIRFSVTKADGATVDTYLKNVAGQGGACTDICSFRNDNSCDDGGANSDSSVCALGSDCTDCGPRGGLTACQPATDAAGAPVVGQSTCPAAFYCHPLAKTCHLNMNSIAGITVDELGAGQSREVSYEAALPPGWSETGTQRLIISANEVKLTRNSAGEVVQDTSQPIDPAQAAVERASGVFNAGDLPIAVPTEPDLVITDVQVDNHAFELDMSQSYKAPALTVNARFLARGVDALQTGEGGIAVQFWLELPGHDVSDPLNSNAYDLNNPNARYKNDRRIPLLLEREGGALLSTDSNSLSEVFKETRATTGLNPSFQAPCAATGTCSQADSDRVVWSEGIEVDGTFRLHIPAEYAKGLSETLNLRSSNPALTAADELPGKLVVSLAAERVGDRNRENSRFEVDVVFMPPAASRPASASANTEPDDDGLSDDGQKASDFPGGVYPETDNLTPMLYDKFGTNWAGASYQVKNVSSKQRLHQAVIKQALLADNYGRVHLLQQDIDIVKIYAEADFGTRRSLTENVAKADVKIPSATGDLFAFLLDGGQVYNTLLALDFDFENNCEEDEDDPNLETCVILGGDEEEPEFGDIDLGVPSIPTDKSYTPLQMEKSKTVCKGPLCFTAGLEASFTVGIEGSLAIFRDSNDAPTFYTGVEATIGPYAEATGTGFGLLSVGLASIGITGTVNLLRADFKPSLRVGLIQQLRGDNTSEPCWWKNNGRVVFDGPARLQLLSGEVKIEAYIGTKISVGAVTINLSKKVAEFTLVKWDPVFDKTWKLWNHVKDFRGGPGLCSDAPDPNTEWRSPIGCKTLSGADAYCGKSIQVDGRLANPRDIQEMAAYNGSYRGFFYTGVSQCGTIVIDGETELHLDVNQLKGDLVNFTRRNNEGRLDSIDGFMRPQDSSICRRVVQRDSGVTFAGGDVGCGDWLNARSERDRMSALESGYYSGSFKETRFRFCNTNSEDDLRRIDFFLQTDATVAGSGVSVRLELDEGAEDAVYSDGRWWVNHAHDAFENDPDLSNSWKRLDYINPLSEHNFRRATSRGPINAAPWGAQPVAPFTAEDGQRAKWIWFGVNPNESPPAGRAYLRRPFLASKNSYKVQVRCDDRCDVYLDGARVGGGTAWDNPSTFEIATQEGRLHMLAIRAENGAVGPAGVHFMMK